MFLRGLWMRVFTMYFMISIFSSAWLLIGCSWWSLWSIDAVNLLRNLWLSLCSIIDSPKPRNLWPVGSSKDLSLCSTIDYPKPRNLWPSWLYQGSEFVFNHWLSQTPKLVASWLFQGSEFVFNYWLSQTPFEIGDLWPISSSKDLHLFIITIVTVCTILVGTCGQLISSTKNLSLCSN